jgi:hypothetical protein
MSAKYRAEKIFGRKSVIDLRRMEEDIEAF